ncbi:hypothetical protein BDN70DRAFT_238897 [Pholiota conissans]|uniref:Uncharacterized protein n=1 Tax=Pholiota conissans TaxID=109636 RepID=A0A9P5ZFQ1_9AGAR|nr:hypothetical protein BDN70DRAFT_238897 [Pholiota conissans]
MSTSPVEYISNDMNTAFQSMGMHTYFTAQVAADPVADPLDITVDAKLWGDYGKAMEEQYPAVLPNLRWDLQPILIPTILDQVHGAIQTYFTRNPAYAALTNGASLWFTNILHYFNELTFRVLDDILNIAEHRRLAKGSGPAAIVDFDATFKCEVESTRSLAFEFRRAFYETQAPGTTFCAVCGRPCDPSLGSASMGDEEQVQG